MGGWKNLPPLKHSLLQSPELLAQSLNLPFLWKPMVKELPPHFRLAEKRQSFAGSPSVTSRGHSLCQTQRQRLGWWLTGVSPWCHMIEFPVLGVWLCFHSRSSKLQDCNSSESTKLCLKVRKCQNWVSLPLLFPYFPSTPLFCGPRVKSLFRLLLFPGTRGAALGMSQGGAMKNVV